VKVAYVTPRYGEEVLGGAELGARMFAERLVGMLGWEVEILTTCALDERTWANEYPAGEVAINGVRVHRFASKKGRHPDFDKLCLRLLRAPWAATPDEQERWIDDQGPLCPDLVEATAATDADLVVFYPYLFYPTVRAIGRVRDRALMHPAAHDEAPIRFPLFRDVFGASRGFVFQTHGERRLVEKLFPIANRRQVVLGLAVEPGAGEAAAARERVGLGDRPYLLCVGRVDDVKGAAVLARLFTTYKRRRPGPLALVYVGQVVDRPPAHPDVVLAGPVDEETKWGLLRGATALVSPSPYEAFSFALLEGWTAGLPVMVNGQCEATREHCERSGGGIWFHRYAEFEAGLDRLLADDDLRTELAQRGLRYVDQHFRWPGIIERYRRFLEGVAAAPV
jgi:glycosyltransferase involved in cell wall biosynthesis